MDPSSKQGPLTRSQSRTTSPLPAGTAPTPSVDTPSHRTDTPWTEVVTGKSTPRTAALAQPPPDHPFESENPFTGLRQTEDDGSDAGSQKSEILLTPGDLTVPPVNVDVGVPPGAVGTRNVAPSADAVLNSLADIVRANAAGITALSNMIRENASSIMNKR